MFWFRFKSCKFKWLRNQRSIEAGGQQRKRKSWAVVCISYLMLRLPILWQKHLLSLIGISRHPGQTTRYTKSPPFKVRFGLDWVGCWRDRVRSCNLCLSGQLESDGDQSRPLQAQLRNMDNRPELAISSYIHSLIDSGLIHIKLSNMQIRHSMNWRRVMIPCLFLWNRLNLSFLSCIF